MNPRFPSICRIGTRASPLAMVQTGLLCEALRAAVPEYKREGALQIIPIRASGDHDPLKAKDEPLVDVGGKGLFTKELEEALLAGTIDIAVHSMKDVPTWLPRSLVIAATLPRSDARDALVTTKGKSLDDLPQGTIFGTCSLRRQAQVLNRRKDLKIVPLRGNIDTRLKKIEDGRVDAALLAFAALKRLGLETRATAILEPDVILPSPAQGIIGIQTRESEEGLRQLLSTINHADTFLAMQAERAMLEVLDGTCTTPIAGLATMENGQMSLKGLVAHPGGDGLWRAESSGAAADAMAIGRDVGRALRKIVPNGILPE